MARVAAARLPEGHPPVVLVVIDTEEEYDWSGQFSRDNISVSAILKLPDLQNVFAESGARPTYVVDYPVAANPASSSVLKGFVEAGVAEVGAHLHPWVTPPFEEEVNSFNSYGGNLPTGLEFAKLSALVQKIRDNIEVAPRSFKAGRYGLGANTPGSLARLGLVNDLSTTPAFNWSGDGGPDFSRYPNAPYWIPGEGPILELPTTGGYVGPLRRMGPGLRVVNNLPTSRNSPLVGLLRRTRLCRRVMLTPEGTSLWELQSLADTLLREGERVLTLSFHSPTIVPGHTAFVKSEADRSEFLQKIQQFMVWMRRTHNATSLTASEVRSRLLPWVSQESPARAR